MKIIDPNAGNLSVAVAEVVATGLVAIEGTATPATRFQDQIVQLLKKLHPQVSPVPGYVDHKDGVTERGYLYVVFDDNHPSYPNLDAVKPVVAVYDQAHPL